MVDEKCSICLESVISHKNKKTLHCEHIFHNLCIEEYIKYSNNNKYKCPICRKYNLINEYNKDLSQYKMSDLEYKIDRFKYKIQKFHYNIAKLKCNINSNLMNIEYITYHQEIHDTMTEIQKDKYDKLINEYKNNIKQYDIFMDKYKDTLKEYKSCIENLNEVEIV